MKKMIAIFILIILPSLVLAGKDSGVIDTLTIGTSPDDPMSGQFNGVITMRGCTGQVGNSATCPSSSLCGGVIYFSSKDPMIYSTLTAVKLSQHIVTIEYGNMSPGQCFVATIAVGAEANTPPLSNLSAPQHCTTLSCQDDLVLLERYTVSSGTQNFTLMNYTLADLLASGGRSQRCPNGIDVPLNSPVLHSLLLYSMINPLLAYPSVSFSYDTNDNTCSLISYQANF